MPVLDLTDEEWQLAIAGPHKVVNGALTSNTIVPSYVDLRTAEYPDIREYIDGIVKGDEQQVKNYIDACLAVKKKYPKLTIAPASP